MPVLGLAALFFLTAALYASVGFGGGSTYIALLALADLDYRALPVIALLCNIIVVFGGTLRFHARGLVDWGRIWPIILLSVPAAWLGGRIPIEQEMFLLLLGGSLLVAALLLLIEPFLRKDKSTGNIWAAGKWFSAHHWDRYRIPVRYGRDWRRDIPRSGSSADKLGGQPPHRGYGQPVHIGQLHCGAGRTGDEVGCRRSGCRHFRLLATFSGGFAGGPDRKYFGQPAAPGDMDPASYSHFDPVCCNANFVAAIRMNRSPDVKASAVIIDGKNGSPSWIRTNGHSINSRMLYH